MKAIMALFQIMSQHLPREIEEIHKKPQYFVPWSKQAPLDTSHKCHTLIHFIHLHTLNKGKQSYTREHENTNHKSIMIYCLQYSVQLYEKHDRHTHTHTPMHERANAHNPHEPYNTIGHQGLL